jgi:tetratricopeptide (TPR) repeat protein
MIRKAGWIAAGVLVLAGYGSGRTVKQEEGLEAGKQAYESSEYTRAVLLLHGAAAVDPKNAEVQLWLARTYYELREHDAAVNSAEKAVKIDPENSRYHEWLGRAYGQKAEHSSWFSALGLAKKTRKEFETAVKLDGQNFAARQALVEYDCSAPGIAGGGEDKARPEIAEIAALDAAEGHYAAGNCRWQKKDFAVADEEFTKALESHPRSADLMYDIGDYWLKRNQAERMLAVAEVGEQANPNDPRGRFYRAAALILKKDSGDDAERLLLEYLKLAPTRTGYPRLTLAHYWLGRHYEERGKRDAAAEEYEAALKLDAKNKLAQEQLKRIRKN